MKKEAFSQFGHPDLILFGFLLFFFCFLGIIVWTFQRRQKDHYQKMAELPLRSEVGESQQ